MIGQKFQIESAQSIFHMDDISVIIKIKSLNIKLKEIHLKRLLFTERPTAVATHLSNKK